MDPSPAQPVAPPVPRAWAPNLYALVELMSGEPIDWLGNGGPLRQLERFCPWGEVDQMFGADPEASNLVTLLRKLASGELSGPQDGGFESVDALLQSVPAPLAEAAAHYRDRAGWLERALPAFARIQSSPLRLQPAPSGPGAVGAPSAAKIAGFAVADRIVADGVTFFDPVQGNLNDCVLIASMIATAWFDPSRWRSGLAQCGFAPPARLDVRWRFFDDGADATGKGEIRFDAKVPVDDKGRPIYARSGEAAESWPSLIEKGYVTWRAAADLGNDGEPRERAYHAIENPPDPALVLHQLWGAPQGDFHRPLARLTGNSGGASLLGTDGVVKQPVIAWTSVSPVPVKAFDRNSDEFAGLIANHAYAVLGMMERKGEHFVVLRNPHDHNPLDPATPGQAPDGKPPLPPPFVSGAWQLASARHGIGEVALNARGVMAIPAAKFDQLFAQIAWVGA